MIILEGTDNLGKTTFAHKLRTRLRERLQIDYAYTHFTVLSPSFRFPMDYLPFFTHNTMLDRFYQSELAYSAARGVQSRVSDAMASKLDAIAELAGCTRVLFLASSTRRVADDREQMFDTGVIQRANEAYDQLYATRRLQFDYILHLDGGNPWPSDQQLESVCQLVRQRRVDASVSWLSSLRLLSPWLHSQHVSG